jgi:hypothetical protein
LVIGSSSNVDVCEFGPEHRNAGLQAAANPGNIEQPAQRRVGSEPG